MFDALGWAEAQDQWAARVLDQVWDDYTRSVEELAASGPVDVLAHPDLAKVAGYRPEVPGAFHDRIAEAAKSSGLTAELSSGGWRKPCAEAYPAPALLSRFHHHGVSITTASDAHEMGQIAWRLPT
jgi:histidinol-phosphatase (PHP family)